MNMLAACPLLYDRRRPFIQNKKKTLDISLVLKRRFFSGQSVYRIALSSCQILMFLQSNCLFMDQIDNMTGWFGQMVTRY